MYDPQDARPKRQRKARGAAAGGADAAEAELTDAARIEVLTAQLEESNVKIDVVEKRCNYLLQERVRRCSPGRPRWHSKGAARGRCACIFPSCTQPSMLFDVQTAGTCLCQTRVLRPCCSEQSCAQDAAALQLCCRRC